MAAMEAPMPRAAPVTITTLSLREQKGGIGDEATAIDMFTKMTQTLKVLFYELKKKKKTQTLTNRQEEEDKKRIFERRGIKKKKPSQRPEPSYTLLHQRANQTL